MFRAVVHTLFNRPDMLIRCFGCHTPPDQDMHSSILDRSTDLPLSQSSTRLSHTHWTPSEPKRLILHTTLFQFPLVKRGESRRLTEKLSGENAALHENKALLRLAAAKKSNNSSRMPKGQAWQGKAKSPMALTQNPVVPAVQPQQPQQPQQTQEPFY